MARPLAMLTRMGKSFCFFLVYGNLYKKNMKYVEYNSWHWSSFKRMHFICSRPYKSS